MSLHNDSHGHRQISASRRLDEDGTGQTRRADVENRSDSHVSHDWFTRSTSTASVRRRCGRVRTLTPRIETVRTPRSAARTVQLAVRTYT